MPRVPLNQLPQDLKPKLLEALEGLGKQRLKNDLYNSLLQRLDPEDLKNKEFLARYLLLAAVMDQQAESVSARETVMRIYESYGKAFFINPEKFVNDLEGVFEIGDRAL